MSDPGRTIDFLGIGAHGAGSTWLYHWLSRHPEIGFLKPQAGRGIKGKEAHYWNRFSDRPLHWYLKQFDWSKRVVGEITPAYARFEEPQIRRIAEHFPDLQVLFMIRDPVDRTWSDTRKRMRKARRSRFDADWMIEQASRPKVAIRNDYVGTVRRWQSVFGPERIHVFLFPDMAERPRAMLYRACEILSVDPSAFDPLPESELAGRINIGLATDCPREFAEWIDAQPYGSWETQVRGIDALGALALPLAAAFPGGTAKHLPEPLENDGRS
jgi:hypothetical protein